MKWGVDAGCMEAEKSQAGILLLVFVSPASHLQPWGAKCWLLVVLLQQGLSPEHRWAAGCDLLLVPTLSNVPPGACPLLPITPGAPSSVPLRRALPCLRCN